MKFGLKSKKEKKQSDLIPDNPKKSLSKEPPISESDLLTISESELFSENTSTFMDLKKLEYQKYPVYVGVARDLTATGEKLYKVVEPSLTKKDEENFALIKKILMQELAIDLNDIKNRVSLEMIEKLEENEFVSMNFWGFFPAFFVESETQFREFVAVNKDNEKAEFFIPLVVDEMMASGKVKVKIIESTAKWMGVTYREDKPVVIEKVQSLVDAGDYPEFLFK